MAQPSPASGPAHSSMSAPAAALVSMTSRSDAQNGNLWLIPELTPAHVAIALVSRMGIWSFVDNTVVSHAGQVEKGRQHQVLLSMDIRQDSC